MPVGVIVPGLAVQLGSSRLVQPSAVEVRQVAVRFTVPPAWIWGPGGTTLTVAGSTGIAALVMSFPPPPG